MFLLAGVVLMVSGGSGYSTLERNRALAADNDTLGVDLAAAVDAAGPTRLKSKLSPEHYARITARISPVGSVGTFATKTKPLALQQNTVNSTEIRAMRESVQNASTAVERTSALLQESQQRVANFASSFGGVIASWQVGMHPGLRQDLGTLQSQLQGIQESLERSAVGARDARAMLNR